MSPVRLRYSALFTALALCLLGRLTATAHAAGLFDGVDTGGRPATGKEVKVHDPDVGGAGYYSIYLPTDYTTNRPFPVIFTFHGQFEAPQSLPFRAITGGKRFIIVGMDYTADSIPQKKIPANANDPMAHEVETLRRIAAALRADLKIDPRQMFVGGYSQGGLQAQAIATRTQELWAGVIVLGAGRVSDAVAPKNLASLPYLFALGDGDPDYPSARLAEDYYRKLGADVTLVTFAGKGHVVDTTDPALLQWLIKYGPHRQVAAAMAAAQVALKSEKFGEALNQFAAVSAMDPSPPDAQAAADGAKSLTDKAMASLAAADAAVASRDNGAAAKELVALVSGYAGNDFGRQAAERLKGIASDPAVVKVIAQAKLDAQSDVLETQGGAAEATADYPKAISTYQLYLSRFPAAHHADRVRAKLLALQSNKAIGAKQAETDCRSWLSLADNCIRSGLPDKARPYLQRILDTYGSTPWADEARARLKQLDGGPN